MYAYCNNNPVMHYDPNGDSFSLLLVCAIAAFAYTCLVATILDGLTEEDSNKDGLFKDSEGTPEYYTFFYDVDVDDVNLGGKQSAVSAEITIGLYEDFVEVDNHIVSSEILTANAYMGMLGLGADVTLFSVRIDEKHEIFGYDVSIAAEFKIGYGLKLSAGEKTGVSFANGIGGSIEIEWED